MDAFQLHMLGFTCRQRRWARGEPPADPKLPMVPWWRRTPCWRNFLSCPGYGLTHTNTQSHAQTHTHAELKAVNHSSINTLSLWGEGSKTRACKWGTLINPWGATGRLCSALFYYAVQIESGLIEESDVRVRTACSRSHPSEPRQHAPSADAQTLECFQSVPVMALRISVAAASLISREACSLYQAVCGVQIRLGASFSGPWAKLPNKEKGWKNTNTTVLWRYYYWCPITKIQLQHKITQ